MQSLGKQNILCRVQKPNGDPVMSIVNSNTVYKRKNGTYYFTDSDRVRHDVQPVTGSSPGWTWQFEFVMMTKH